MVKVEVSDIGFDDASQMGIVLLLDIKTRKVLPIWVGLLETQAILLKMKSIPVDRPMTHDLLKSAIEKMGGRVTTVTIKELKNNTFYAEITVKTGHDEIKIDSRPSDAIALALRTGSQILVLDELMKNSPKKEEFEDKQKHDLFKNILEKLDSKEIPRA